MKNMAFLEKINNEKQYTRRELYNLIADDMAEYSYNSFNWDLQRMLAGGEIYRSGRNSYKIGNTDRKNYTSKYSERAEEIIAFMENNYSDTEYSLFETSMLNEFLNHQIAKNTVSLYVEKELSEFVFRDMSDLIVENILFKPKKDDLRKYWKPDTIIIVDRISEAPRGKEKRYDTPLEKLFVDLIADVALMNMYSKSEYPEMLHIANDKYYIDTKKLFRYARRRGKFQEIKRIMTDGGMEIDIT